MMVSRLQRLEKKKGSKIRNIVGIVITILVISGIFLAWRVYGFYRGIKQPTRKLIVTKSPEERYTYNLLILGYGGGKHDGAYLTDTIMIVHADTKKKKAVLISIPRDVWVKVPTTTQENFHYKINALYEMGLFPQDFPNVDKKYLAYGDSAGLIKYAGLEILGFPIDAYVSVDFSGFTKAIDILGGVDVVVDRAFSDYEYPIAGKETDLCGRDEEFKQIEPLINKQMSEEDKVKLFKEKSDLENFFNEIKDEPNKAFPCRYVTLQFEAGPAHMDGEIALKYSRSRHSLQDGGDFNRAKRQQKILEAVKDKFLSIGGLTKILPLMDEMQNYIKTDVPEDDIRRLFPEIKNLNEYEIIPLVIAEPQYVISSYSDYGQYILLPKSGKDNWRQVQTDVKNIMDGITPAPTLSKKNKTN